MKKSILLCFILIVSINSLKAQSNLRELRSLPPQDTVKVRVGFNLKNISSVNEIDETLNIEATLYLLWKDTRLQYQPDSTYIFPQDSTQYFRYSPPEIYTGDYQVKEEFLGWHPKIVIPNGVGNRTVNEISIEVWPNGFVKYQESFNAKIESPMDLRLIPFDKQSLEIYFHPFNYSRNEVMLVPCKSLSRIWTEDRGIAQWKRLDNEIKERPREIHYFDDTKYTVSELTFIVNVKRKPLNMLVSIIFPLIILVCLTWCVFWMDEETVASRVNITFIGILSVVAYYLVIQDKIPEISYITVIDVFIILTFGILASTVIVSIKVDKLNRNNKRAIGDRLDRISRWLFPTVYFAASLLIIILFQIFS